MYLTILIAGKKDAVAKWQQVCNWLLSCGVTHGFYMQGYIHTPGKIGVVSRSGTLTYEVSHDLTCS